MRKTFITVCLGLGSCLAATAQADLPRSYNKPYVLPSLQNPVILKKDKKPIQGTIVNNQQAPRVQSLKGVLTGRSVHGSIYSMSPDNMPVVVPGTGQIPYMPGAQPNPGNKDVEPMPNPYRPK